MIQTVKDILEIIEKTVIIIGTIFGMVMAFKNRK